MTVQNIPIGSDKIITTNNKDLINFNTEFIWQPAEIPGIFIFIMD